MKSLFSSLLVGACALALAAPAHAAPARTINITAGETVTWNGATATGLNVNYFDAMEGAGGAYGEPGKCSTDVRTYCDTTLVKLSNPVPESDADGKLSKTARITLSDYGPLPDPATDYDLLAFNSDATGVQGAELARDGDLTDAANETVSFAVRTTTEQPDAYVLVQVVYFAAINGTYKGTLKF